MALPQPIWSLVDAISATSQSIYEDWKTYHLYVPYADCLDSVDILIYKGATFPGHDKLEVDQKDEIRKIRIDKALLKPPSSMEPVWISAKGMNRDLVNDCVRRWRTAGYDAGSIPIGVFAQPGRRWICTLNFSCGCGEATFVFKFLKVRDSRGRKTRGKKGWDEKHQSSPLDPALAFGTSECLVGPFLDAPRNILPPMDALIRIGQKRNVDRFALRDLSAKPHAPDERRESLDWFIAYNGVTMIFDPKVYQTGPIRFLYTSALRYETIWEDLSPSMFPCIASIFWDWETNQYLRLMALSSSTSFNYHNVDLNGGGGGYGVYRGDLTIKCTLESIAINPLTPAVVWKDRAKKHKTFANEILSTCRCILPPLCTIIASFTF